MATLNPPNQQKPIQHQCLRRSHNEKFGLTNVAEAAEAAGSAADGYSSAIRSTHRNLYWSKRAGRTQTLPNSGSEPNV